MGPLAENDSAQQGFVKSLWLRFLVIVKHRYLCETHSALGIQIVKNWE